MQQKLFLLLLEKGVYGLSPFFSIPKNVVAHNTLPGAVASENKVLHQKYELFKI